MRLQVALILVLLLIVTAATSTQMAFSNSPSLPAVQNAPTAQLKMADGQIRTVQLEIVNQAAGPLTPTAGQGTDACSEATSIGVNDTGLTIVPNDFTLYDVTDPVLTCRWLNPDRGFRTVWYKLTADSTSQLVIDTSESTYDTILAVHAAGDPDNACTTLIQVACNDDDDVFTSQVSLPVRAGETYYIEVADYHSAYQGNPAGSDNLLYVSTFPNPINNQWIVAPNDPASTTAQRSRHMAVVVGQKVYIIAGQTSSGGGLVRTPDTVVYNLAESDPAKAWQTLQPMGAGSDGFGYSNTTAALVNGKIYIPSGFVGIDGTYDGTHWVYDINAARWFNSSDDPSVLSANVWEEGKTPIFSESIVYPWLGFNGYFVIGGLTGYIPTSNASLGFEARAETYFYSTLDRAWLRVADNLNEGRFGHTAALQVIDGADHLCVTGGFGENNVGQRKLLATTECFSITGGNWQTIASADLNYPRYYADSSVNSRGDWYIYGGFDANGIAVPVVERFDRHSKQWIDLGVSYDLGAANLNNPTQDARPARAWPRGGFNGDELWVFGGENRDNDIVNLIEHIHLFHVSPASVASRMTLPLILKQASFTGEPDNTFATARSLAFNAPQENRYFGSEDTVDVFTFDVPTFQSVTIKVTNLPRNSTYVLYYFRETKAVVMPSATNLGNTSLTDTRQLGSGRYYVILERQFPMPVNDPNPPPYTIELQH